MPAEWEPHEATWLAWPHQPRRLARQVRAHPLGLRARSSASSRRARRVRILVQSARARGRARGGCCERAGVDLGRVEFLRFPTDRGWTRDHGPDLRARRGARRSRSPASASTPGPSTPTGRRTTGCRCARRARFELPLRAGRRTKGRDVVLEGGSIDVNGRGTLLTTEECLLDPRAGAQPRASRARTRGGARATPGRAQGALAGQGHRRRRHARPRRRPLPLRRSAHGRARARRTNPRTRTTRRSQENRERLAGDARSRTARGSRWCRCRCRRRSSSTGSACRRATRTSTSPTPPCWCRRSTIPPTASALGMLGRAVPRPPRGRHPRGRPGVGPRHAALPDAAAAGAAKEDDDATRADARAGPASRGRLAARRPVTAIKAGRLLDVATRRCSRTS